MPSRPRLFFAVLALTLVVAPIARAEFQETQKITADRLTVRNLIGEVKVRGHSGTSFEVTVHVQGRDGTPDRVKIRTDQGGDASLTVVFPEERRFVYPRLGSGSRTTFTANDDDKGWLSQIFDGVTGRNRIDVRGSGDGAEIWADLTILVPANAEIRVAHGVGRVEAEDIQGDADLSTRSGSVRVDGVDGSLIVDTGSGHVAASRVRGDVNIDTGSGHVEGRDFEGDTILVDTGSGHVELDSVRGRSLDIDTGSGRVRATGVSIDSARIDTGSGGVLLELEQMGDGDFLIDTGSGGIELRIPRGASGDFRAETGSGGVHLDLEDGVQLRSKQRDEVVFSVGGGASQVTLDTGSGGIRISYSD